MQQENMSWSYVIVSLIFWTTLILGGLWLWRPLGGFLIILAVSGFAAKILRSYLKVVALNFYIICTIAVMWGVVVAYSYVAVVYISPITSIIGKAFFLIVTVLAAVYPGATAGAGLQRAIQSTLLNSDDVNTKVSERVEQAIIMERIHNNLKIFRFCAIGGYIAIQTSRTITTYILTHY